MGLELHNVLKGLCFDSKWKYAVFWKLWHGTRMFLTLEDAYYDNYECLDALETSCERETVYDVHVGRYSHDRLGLALAKMSYLEYSFGEGIIGQVAATGKHQWVFTNKPAINSMSFEVSDCWRSQFSAGIRTVVVVAVVPYGVMQLGSLEEVGEDIKLTTHIKDVFMAVQDTALGHVTSPSRLDASSLLYKDQMQMNMADDDKCGGETSSWNDLCKISEKILASSSSVFNGGSKMDCMECEPDRVSNTCKYLDKEKGIEKKLENLTCSCDFQFSNPFTKFSAGWELHEALGPAFLEKYSEPDSEPNKIKDENLTEMPEMISSRLTFGRDSENLLEAVVGTVFNNDSDAKSEKSVCESVYNSVEMPERSVQTQEGRENRHAVVEGYSWSHSTSTVLSDIMSHRGISSTCPRVSNEHLDKRPGPAKTNKKRAKHGANGKPRPRDRQLIQDRIKELRELVPNGSKCSIDSLLERTIKHMLFLESVTNHANKLSKCAKPKMHKEVRNAFNTEQGSSWAVEVGACLKVSSIMVENLNENGQMLVEMVCEECNHFLEIAEAIRSLGLTILKGIAEVHGKKMWICFVVEEQNHRMMHRMDILWSLMQMLQPTATS